MNTEQIFTITRTNSLDQKPNKSRATCSFCLIHLWIFFVVVLPASGIVVGVLYRHQCPLERHLSLWEIVNGSITILFLFLIFLTRHTPKHETLTHQLLAHVRDRNWSLFILDQLKVLCIFFLFAWFICGNIWTYRNLVKVQYDHPDQLFYCHPILYQHAFWYITAVYICLGLCLICSITLTCFRRS